MSQLPFDIVRVIYGSIEPADARHALLDLLVASKAFYEVFYPELYRHITVATADHRIARLVKTLRAKSHLKNKVETLIIRLEIDYRPPTTFRHVFSTEPLERFARFVAKGQLPNLRYLAFDGEPGYASFTHWTSLSPPVQKLFFRIRCLKTIRSLRVDCIEELDPALVWGRDSHLSLDALQLSHVWFTRDPVTRSPFTTFPQPDRPHLVKTLAIHTAWRLKLSNPASFCHLVSFSFIHPLSASSTVSDKYAIIDACKNTLCELRIRIFSRSPPTSLHFGTGPDSEPVLQLDLTQHSKLHTVVIASTAIPLELQLPLEQQAHFLTKKELEMADSFLTRIDLPPALRLLGVRLYLMDWGNAKDQPADLFDLFTEWELIHHFEHLFGMATSTKGGRVQQLEVGITPMLPLRITSVQLRDLKLRLCDRYLQARGGWNSDWISFYVDNDTGAM